MILGQLEKKIGPICKMKMFLLENSNRPIQIILAYLKTILVLGLFEIILGFIRDIKVAYLNIFGLI